MSSSEPPGPIPARWLHCPRKASNLVAQKFLAFKTPLSSQYDSVLSPEFRFPPKMLFGAMKSYKIKLGLWIDLTNTDRFYDTAEVENSGCKYIKIKCRGHGETPSVEQTQLFLNVVSHFIRNNPLDAIGIHCTHGFNRTGFLIVSYLVEHMDCSVEAAIKEFSKVREPGIYKGDYLTELYKRYDEIEETPMPPDLPNWHTESDDGNRDDNHYEAESAGFKSKRRGREVNKVATFMSGIAGVLQFTTQPRLSEIQKKIQKMCGWKTSGFPGSQPVSMDNTNLRKLGEKGYRVSWKADGTRYMMLIDGEDEVYLFDRDNCAFSVKGLKFISRNDPKVHLVNTLLDGEMVIDKAEGKNIPRYLCYDIICFNGEDMVKRQFYPDRLNYIDKEIIAPRYLGIKEGRINRSIEVFGVRLKQFWDISQTANLLGEKFAKTLCHEPDGLIFQPSKDPYTAGRCDDVLKWKPSNLNSVDFKLKIVTQEGEGILRRKVGNLHVGQLIPPFDTMTINKEIRELDGKIIECKIENNRWVFMRERTDKSFPNSYETAKAVVNSIMHPVTQEILLNFINTSRYYDDSDRMPPPPKRRC